MAYGTGGVWVLEFCAGKSRLTLSRKEDARLRYSVL